MAGTELIAPQPVHTGIVSMEQQIFLRSVLKQMIGADLILRKRYCPDLFRRMAAVIPEQVARG